MSDHIPTIGLADNPFLHAEMLAQLERTKAETASIKAQTWAEYRINARTRAEVIRIRRGLEALRRDELGLARTEAEERGVDKLDEHEVTALAINTLAIIRALGYEQRPTL